MRRSSLRRGLNCAFAHGEHELRRYGVPAQPGLQPRGPRPAQQPAQLQGFFPTAPSTDVGLEFALKNRIRSAAQQGVMDHAALEQLLVLQHQQQV